jgi:hypothetical protein
MFQVLAGKSTTPFSPLTPQQLLGTRSGHLNIIGEGYGEFYSGRFAQVRGTVHFNENIRLAVALVDPNGTMAAVGQQDPYGGIWEKDTKIPRIDVSMPIYVGSFKLYPSVFWQQRRIDVAQDKYSSYDDCLHPGRSPWA